MMTDPDSQLGPVGRKPKPAWLTEADLFMQADLAHARDGYVARTAHLDNPVLNPSLLDWLG